MQGLRKILSLVLIALGILLCSGCHPAATKEDSTSTALKIGVTPGPQEEIMVQVQGLAHQQGLELELVEYTDYAQANLDLHQGKLWANSLQHLPYLETTLAKEPKFQLAAAFKTISYPLALYPGQRQGLLDTQALHEKTQVKEFTTPTRLEPLAKLTIGIPSDPTSLSRSLRLLAAARYLNLNAPDKELLTLADVSRPTLQVQLIPMDAALLPQMLLELDMAVISCNYALVNGLRPAQDAIFMETSNNPYVNIFVTNREQLTDPRLQQLKELYHSKAIKEFIQKKYQGAILPSW